MIFIDKYELIHYFLNNVDLELRKKMFEWLQKRNRTTNEISALHEMFKKIVNQHHFLNEIDYHSSFYTLKENINNPNFKPSNESEQKFIELFKNNQNQNLLNLIAFMIDRKEDTYYNQLYFFDGFKIKSNILYKQVIVLFNEFRDEIIKNNHKHNYVIFKYIDQELPKVDRVTLFTNFRNRIQKYETKNKRNKEGIKINIK